MALKWGFGAYAISTWTTGEFGTVKPVLSGHSKRRSKLVFKTDYRLIQVKSIAECSKRAFCNTFGLHLYDLCLSIFEWPLKLGLTVQNSPLLSHFSVKVHLTLSLVHDFLECESSNIMRYFKSLVSDLVYT